MTPLCDVQSCRRDGTEDAAGNDDHHDGPMANGRLCRPHASAWDEDKENRERRLHDLAMESPDATDAEIWAEHYSRWCGGQR